MLVAEDNQHWTVPRPDGAGYYLSLSGVRFTLCGWGWSYTGPAQCTSSHQRCGWWWASAPRANTTCQQPEIEKKKCNKASFLHGLWLTQNQPRQLKGVTNMSGVNYLFMHNLLSYQKGRETICASAKQTILLTFMNCSMALEDSELDRNKVFGSAWRAGTEKKKTQWLEQATMQLVASQNSRKVLPTIQYCSATVTLQEKKKLRVWLPALSVPFIPASSHRSRSYSAKWELCGRACRCECE